MIEKIKLNQLINADKSIRNFKYCQIDKIFSIFGFQEII
jgi:hypothetical protein